MKQLKVKHKITADLVLDLYEKAKKAKGKKKEELLKQATFLSKNIGAYLAKSVSPSKDSLSSSHSSE
jgi:hypothetical protein